MRLSRSTHLLMFLETLTSQTTLLRWLTFLPRSLYVIVTILLFLDLIISSDSSFVLQWLSLHWETLIIFLVSVSIDFSSHSQQDALFHRNAYDCSRTAYDYADWDGLCDHLRDVTWEDIFRLSASTAASEFYEWVQVGIDAYVLHRKYQVKPHSSLWFSAAFATAVVHRNHFSFYQKDKSSESKVKFRQASNRS